jgi:hypothetical protein
MFNTNINQMVVSVTGSSVINKVHGFSRQKGQMYGLTIRELGGGVPHHHRAPSVRGASYHIVEPSVLVNRIQMIKTLRGHRNAVYCGKFSLIYSHSYYHSMKMCDTQDSLDMFLLLFNVLDLPKTAFCLWFLFLSKS